MRSITNSVVLGTQWGDEGKGKMVDTLARSKKYKAVVRYQGGNNAGHTVVVKGERYALHLIPSGILYPDKTCVIGNGVIVNPEVLAGEITNLEKRVGKSHARLLISEKAHLIMPWHMIRDGITGGKIGTTSRGIGPTYTDYIKRCGIRFMDTTSKKRFAARVKEELRWNKKLIKLILSHHRVNLRSARLNLDKKLHFDTVVSSYWKWISALRKNPLVEIGDASAFLFDLQESKKSILFEGAQGLLLDIAFGTYPYVTSSNPTTGGVYTGTGMRPKNLKIIGVAKAYTTRVGHGPFLTELKDKVGMQLRKVGNEYGTTTGRPRRCGWLDLTILRYAKVVNGLDALAIPKLDVLTGIDPLKIAVGYKIGKQTLDVFTPDLEKLARVKVIYQELPGWDQDITKCRNFNQLPPAAQNYIKFIEQMVKLPIEMIGVGPGREEIVIRS